MQRRIVTAPALLIVCLAGCAGGGKSDFIEAEAPLPSTAIVLTAWHPSLGFVVDKNERLLVTSFYGLSGRTECEVIFPPMQDGKALARRDALEKAPRVAARLIASDPRRDVAVLQLAALPEGATELKLAAASPTPEAPVQLLGIAPRPGNRFALAATAVKGSAAQKLAYNDTHAVNARMIEFEADGKLAKESAGGPVLNEAGEVVAVVAAEPAQKDHLQAVDVADIRAGLSKAYRDLGTRAFQARDYDKSIAYCDRALAVYPDDPLAYNERGAAYSFLNKLDLAIADYDAAVKLDKKFARAYRNRGSAYLHQRDYNRAVADCDKAIAINGDYIQAYYTRAQAYAGLGRKQDAAKDETVVAELSKPQWIVTSTTGDTSIPKVDPPKSYRGPIARSDLACRS